MKTLIFTTLFAALIGATSVHATFECYLRLEGIPGESMAEGHKGEIDVGAFDLGNSMVISFGPTGGSGKASFTDLNIRKALDKASPILMLNCAKGTPVRSAVLTCRAGPDRQIVYKITMSDVYISKVVLHADSLADRPTESVSLTYARIQWEYTPTLADGRPGTPVETGWDVKANVQQ